MCADCKLIRVQIGDMQSKCNQMFDLIKRQQSMIETLVKSSNNSSNSPTLPDCLVGTSLISDIDPNALVNTDIICVPGAELPQVTSKYKESGKRYKITSIQAGGNDCCSRKEQKSVAEIGNHFRELVSAAKDNSDDVVVGSILPRGKVTPEQAERRDAVNAELVTICSDLDVTYQNNEPFFKFDDGSLNDGYFIDDKVHLNAAGANRLATRLDLQIKESRKNNVTKPRAHNPRTNPNPRPAPRGNAPSHLPNNNSRFFQHSSNAENNRAQPSAWSIQRPRSGYARRDAFTNTPIPAAGSKPTYTRNPNACDYCQETNHTKRVCRHWLNNRPPPTCNTCGEAGHKAKHHLQGPQAVSSNNRY